ncbi:MAG: transcriptional repressor [Duncaniella sp.]|uniref:Fur family transcriptional regulator n=1 Tax=Duncaniella sp. TaxID=2518496 RepID=UPI0023C1A5F1|nr:transcriptional repressor [Duncaniella sp.]MDE5989402.1 transcriptional repressor [Duncaniella sp.]
MNDEKRKSEAENRLRRYLSQHHLRCTPERLAILGAVTDARGPFSPADLFRVISEKDFRLSQATVYNTLKLLEAADVVRRRPTSDGVDTYESTSRVDEHMTLLCSRCGRSRELRDAELTKLLKLRRYPSFVMSGFDLYIHGLCSRCRGGGRSRRNSKEK